MIPALSLRRNFSWNLVANAIYGGYQWLLIALLAQWAGATTVGQYSLALAVVTPIQMLLNLQLRAIQASDARGKYHFSHYLQLRLTTTAMLLLVVITMTALWPFDDGVRFAIMGVVMVKAIESLVDIVYGAFQQAERMDLSGQSRILESILATAAFAIIFGATGNLFLALVAMAGALCLVLMVISLPRLRYVTHDWMKLDCREAIFHRFKQLAIMGAPLGIAMALLTLNSALPRLALGYFKTEFEIGIYAGFYQLVIAGTIVIGALGQAVTPVLARYFVSADVKAFYRLLDRLTGFALMLGACAAVAAAIVGEYVVSLIYTKEYSGHQGALVTLAVSSSFTFAGSFQGYALTSARILTSQSWMSGTVLVITAILLFLLVPHFGVLGASLGVLGGSITQYVIGRWLLRTRFPKGATV